MTDAPSPLAVLPESRADRWNLLREMIGQWYRPLTDRDGYPEPVGPVELPLALREWYQLCGRRGDVWSVQDRFLDPHRLETQGSYLVFYVENQAVVQWGIQLEEAVQEDPPVWIERTEGQWTPESPTVSQFALGMLASCLKFSSVEYLANGDAPPEILNVVRKHYPRLGMPNWTWPANPTQFFGNRNLVVEVNGDEAEDYIWLWISARTESAFEGFLKLVAPLKTDWDRPT